jgi:glutathione S-transferase
VLVGDSLTVADLALWYLIEFCQDNGFGAAVARYPLLGGFATRIGQRPRIAEYLKSSRRHPFVPLPSQAVAAGRSRLRWPVGSGRRSSRHVAARAEASREDRLSHPRASPIRGALDASKARRATGWRTHDAG